MHNMKIYTCLLLIGTLAALMMTIGPTGLPGIRQSNDALKSVYLSSQAGTHNELMPQSQTVVGGAIWV
jgi:hypothetical protein